jgi:hypothetical protein
MKAMAMALLALLALIGSANAAPTLEVDSGGVSATFYPPGFGDGFYSLAGSGFHMSGFESSMLGVGSTGGNAVFNPKGPFPFSYDLFGEPPFPNETVGMNFSHDYAVAQPALGDSVTVPFTMRGVIGVLPIGPPPFANPPVFELVGHGLATFSTVPFQGTNGVLSASYGFIAPESSTLMLLGIAGGVALAVRWRWQRRS